jgi:hypothetical protein
VAEIGPKACRNLLQSPLRGSQKGRARWRGSLRKSERADSCMVHPCYAMRPGLEYLKPLWALLSHQTTLPSAMTPLP